MSCGTKPAKASGVIFQTVLRHQFRKPALALIQMGRSVAALRRRQMAM
jgi:hypothetical protein